MSNSAIREKRDQTQAHYDKYPFRFDQRAIVDEKMENRLMGAAILELPDSGARIVDVGCGACRVAHMVRQAGKGGAFSVDISLQTLPYCSRDRISLPIYPHGKARSVGLGSTRLQRLVPERKSRPGCVKR